MTDSFRPETIALHGGQTPDPVTGSRAVPIHQTTSYQFKDSEHAANLFALKEFGNIYTRLMNPTTDVFEKRLAALDGGVGALAVSSGQAATTLALLNIAQAGDEIVSADNLYGGTYNLFRHTFPRLGIKVHFVPSHDLAAFEKAIGPKCKAVYAESIGNPKLDVTDLRAAFRSSPTPRACRSVLDNTLSPFLLRPFEHGVDIAVYSATKFIGGHGTSIGGVIVDSGKFDWSSGKFPLISAPDPSYHGLEFIQALAPLGNIAYIIKARVTLLRDLGSAVSPFNSFLFLQGFETLHLRMARHSENALAVARWLAKHPKVAWVNYPGLESGPEHARTRKYLPRGAGAILEFGVKTGLAGGRKFIDSLQLISHLANVGDAKTLAIHPATTTHQQLSPEEQHATGVTPDFVRLSVGLEHVDDIIADLDQALGQGLARAPRWRSSSPTGQAPAREPRRPRARRGRAAARPHRGHQHHAAARGLRGRACSRRSPTSRRSSSRCSSGWSRTATRAATTPISREFYRPFDAAIAAGPARRPHLDRRARRGARVRAGPLLPRKLEGHPRPRARRHIAATLGLCWGGLAITKVLGIEEAATSPGSCSACSRTACSSPATTSPPPARFPLRPEPPLGHRRDRARAGRARRHRAPAVARRAHRLHAVRDHRPALHRPHRPPRVRQRAPRLRMAPRPRRRPHRRRDPDGLRSRRAHHLLARPSRHRVHRVRRARRGRPHRVTAARLVAPAPRTGSKLAPHASDPARARHGEETAWNALGKLQGHTDIPLNEVGRDQARALAAALATAGVTAVWTSDLVRARETGALIATALGLAAPDVDPELRERSFGVFEGLTRAECETQHPDAWRDWVAQTGSPPGGEPRADAIARLGRALGRIAATDGGAALVVSHGGVMRLWLMDLLGTTIPLVANGTTYVIRARRPHGARPAARVACAPRRVGRRGAVLPRGCKKLRTFQYLNLPTRVATAGSIQRLGGFIFCC